MWTKGSWRAFPAKQQPPYTNNDDVNTATAKLAKFPGLVCAKDVIQLKQALADAALGKRFLVIGGDCAEPFDVCQQRITANYIALRHISKIISHGSKVPSVVVGRMAGQYGKPRSSDTEIIDGVEYASFRGFNVNSLDLSQRDPNPQRLVEGYLYASATYTLLSQLTRTKQQYKTQETRERMKECNRGINGSYESILSQVDRVLSGQDDSKEDDPCFIAHESLVLPYEEAMTREITDERGEKHAYNLGAHMLWIGFRTKQLDHAHVEYCRGISNPIGIKIGPTDSPQNVVKLVKTLNPQNERGKIVLITRFGCDKVESLAPIAEAVSLAGLKVVWQCDPMHGNTYAVKDEKGTKFKTRNVASIVDEIIKTRRVLEDKGERLGGLHLEMTGEAVTECCGGVTNIDPSCLSERYETACDPRLNYTQSIEVACALSSCYVEQSPHV